MSNFARDFDPAFIDYKSITCIRCYNKQVEPVYKQDPIITWIEININTTNSEKTYYVDIFTMGNKIYDKEPFTIPSIKYLMEKVKACHE